MTAMRIDVFLTERGLCRSRTEAKNLIEEGKVTVGGKVVAKPSFLVEDDTGAVSVNRESVRFVSRGGLKLDGALKFFSVTPSGRICLDVGASSGGFTDCMLKEGASLVLAVDSGKGQLSEELLSDKRVISYESFNARYMTPSSFDFTPSFAVMDVSFISSTLIIPAVFSVLSGGSDFILLVKPQFEVGRANIGKGGIVKSERAREDALDSVIEFAKGVGFMFVNSTTSPIPGGDGNIEYLVHFRKP